MTKQRIVVVSCDDALEVANQFLWDNNGKVVATANTAAYPVFVIEWDDDTSCNVDCAIQKCLVKINEDRV
jgi:hypothetical protein